MKLALAFMLLISQSVFSQELRQVIMSAKPSKSALLITHKGERLFFQRCQLFKDQLGPVVDTSDCKFIGTTEGYTKPQIERRIVELERQSKKRSWIKGMYILAGAGIGFVAGAGVGQAWSLHFYRANLYAAMFNVNLGVIVGTGAGMVVAANTQDFISDLIQGGNPDMALEILKSNSTQVLKLESPVSKLDEELNFALMGIK